MVLLLDVIFVGDAEREAGPALLVALSGRIDDEVLLVNEGVEVEET